MFLKISQFIKNTQQENTEYNDKKKLHIEVKQELNIKTPLHIIWMNIFAFPIKLMHLCTKSYLFIIFGLLAVFIYNNNLSLYQHYEYKVNNIIQPESALLLEDYSFKISQYSPNIIKDENKTEFSEIDKLFITQNSTKESALLKKTKPYIDNYYRLNNDIGKFIIGTSKNGIQFYHATLYNNSTYEHLTSEAIKNYKFNYEDKNIFSILDNYKKHQNTTYSFATFRPLSLELKTINFLPSKNESQKTVTTKIFKNTEDLTISYYKYQSVSEDFNNLAELYNSTLDFFHIFIIVSLFNSAIFIIFLRPIIKRKNLAEFNRVIKLKYP